MRRTVLAALGLPVLLCALLVHPLPAAAGSSTVKFSVTEYKIKVDPESEAPWALEIKGKASAYGNEYIDFKWSVPDVRPYLPLLQACAVGRLTGEVSVDDDKDMDGKAIEGEGPLRELTCRVILK
jgi:hypothetical protein